MKNVYAYMGPNDITEVSSSGGAFMQIAKVFFDTYREDGRVFGVALNESMEVEYVVADTFEKCKVFQGSKYVKCDIRDAIKKIINYLEEGKAVLFVGTPCAVASVKRMARAKQISLENLWLIDLICHGTVDRKVWRDYIKWIERRHKEKIVGYSFRYKKVGWRGYPVYIKFSNGLELIDTYEARTYIRAFLKEITIKEHCFHCAFKKMERVGDITLGDFWGAELTIKQKDIDRGVSLILENTELGNNIIKCLKKQSDKDGSFLEKMDNEKFLIEQDNLKQPLQRPKEYNVFKKNYEKYGFDVAIRKAGIFTLWGRVRAIGILLLKKIGLYSILKNK